ncbi:MAG: tetratricopeptide repeat protein [Treponema sp.]|nr:tetratricopeptide repeat protein [Treponema sp.]
MAELNRPMEDLPLPDAETSVPGLGLENTDESGAVSERVEARELPPDGDSAEPRVSEESAWDDNDDFDFGDLLGPDLSLSETMPEALESEEPPDEDIPEFDVLPEDDSSVDDLEGSPADTLPPLDLPPEDPISLDDLEDSLDLPPHAEEEGSPADTLPPLELPEEDIISLDDLEDSLDFPSLYAEEEDSPADTLPPSELPPEDTISLDDDREDSLIDTIPPVVLSPEDDSSLDALDVFLAESESAENNSVSNQGEDSLSLGDDASLEGLSPDTFNPFKAETDAVAGQQGSSPGFSLENLDEDLAAIKPSTDIEEILLTDDDLAQISKTLDSYPLNLRIACEEAIAEQAVEPALMSKLIKSLVKGASVKEMVPLVGKILGRIIIIPKTFEKKTEEAQEAEYANFGYIFVHKFLPVFRLFLIITLVVASLGYLIYRFIYTPVRADILYKKGYEDLRSGDYTQANERFSAALRIHPLKRWFYWYAEGFRDDRQYIYAEEKYDELLRYYPRDKKGVLDYAYMETNYLNNYAKADSLLRRNILDYTADDKEGLLAVGDNALAWGDIEPQRYEDAREVYARYLERYGWVDPVVERMLKYFIRTDNLKEVLPLQAHFMDNPKTKITPASLAELGGYLLDKKLEEARGVPNEYISHIDGIRDILVKAANMDLSLPESHYHLARYYNYFDNVIDERITLERAIQAFDSTKEALIRRLNMRIDTERRYARLLINQKEFFTAEEHLVKGIGLYEDGLNRQILSPAPQFGRLYADMGDLAYFTQEGNMETALEYYRQSEKNGWAPPEMQYRMGSAYYHQREWASALERFFVASSEISLNRRLLNALGNAAYMRGDYFTAQGYYSRLLDVLYADRIRFPILVPNERTDHLELAERLMVVRNNLGVTLEALTERTGDNQYRSQALGLYTESARAWDALTRNPETMVRSGAGELSSPGFNLAFLNSRNSLYPEPGYEAQIYIQIDKDVLEPSPWESLAPQSFHVSDTLF